MIRFQITRGLRGVVAVIINSISSYARINANNNLARSPLLPSNSEPPKLETPTSNDVFKDNTFKIALRAGGLNGTGSHVKTTLEDKKVIAELSSVGVSRKELAAGFNVSQDTIDNVANGRINRSDIHDVDGNGELKSIIEKNLETLREKAVDKLLLGIDLVTTEKMDAVGIQKLTGSLANLSRIVEKITPRNNEGARNKVIIFAPHMSEEKHFKTIDIDRLEDV